MSKLLALTKVLLKNNLLSLQSNSKKNKNKYFGIIGFILIFILVMGSIGIPIIFAIDSVLEILPIKNILLAFILPFAGIATIIFSVFSVVSVFYLSKDVEHLLPMPIKAKDILLAKFLVSLVNQYYILIMFILPCLIGVGVGIDASLLYYIYTAVVFLFLPVIPSVIVTFIILLITKFTGIMKNKDMFMYVSTALIVVFALGYNYIVQSFITIDLDNVGMTIKGVEDALLPYLRNIFPFYNSGVTALVNYNNLNGIFSLITFVAFNFLAVVIMYFAGEKLYLKTLTITRGNKKKSESIEEILECKNDKKNNTFSWLLRKEWLIIKRTPIFMLNIVVIVFLMPLILFVSIFISYLSTGGNVSVPINVDVNKFISDPFIYLVILAVLVFFTSTSFACSTSISREGNYAWFMKVIPVSYFKQINVKVFFGVLLDMLGVLLIAVIPIIMYKIPFYYVLCVFIPLSLIVIILNYFNILLDLKKPRLNWSEEAAAVKQNMNGLFSMLITSMVCVIFGLLAFLFKIKDINMNVIILSSVITIISGIILALVVKWFYKNNNKLLDNVD